MWNLSCRINQILDLIFIYQCNVYKESGLNELLSKFLDCQKCIVIKIYQ